MARKKPGLFRTPEVCPVCGEEVPRGAVACPECGADHNSGWREGAASDDVLGAREDDFDYEEFVEREFGSSPKPAGIKPVWWLTAIILLLLFAAIYFWA
ncbi:MAG: zinc ribbon domain-containing protein [Chthoniobacterales bacterium]